ncbi:MAG: phosphate-binding protein PstS [Planctomycetota bacterium]|nr:MAG: phosphate-binding protein PstS [Planctomycetota bacterium]
MKLLSNSLRVLAPAVLMAAGVSAQAVPLDEKLPDYEQISGVSGSIKSVGSDTMNNLMTLWGEGFKRMYPSVQIEIEGKGSSTAPPSLIAGTSNFGPMSREMKAKEIDSFEDAYGHQPTPLPTSIDMLAVYVHKDNPVEGLSLRQVDAMFSKTRKGGAAENVRTWGELGLSGEWATRPISLYGRNSASGTYGFFKGNALFKGDFKDNVKEQPGSSAVIQGVATDKAGVGYSGIGYKTADVRAVPLSIDDDYDPVPAEPQHAYTGEYPLSRFLLLYVNKAPNEELDPLRREFIMYIFSKQGQADVIKAGYYPVTSEIALNTLHSLGIETPDAPHG